MNSCNQIAICRDNFNTEKEWKESISTFIFELMKNRQVAVVREEENGIMVVEFNNDKPSFGGSLPYWLYPEEAETIIYRGEEDECEDD